jgi:uncharacterized protein DUF4157
MTVRMHRVQASSAPGAMRLDRGVGTSHPSTASAPPAKSHPRPAWGGPCDLARIPVQASRVQPTLPISSPGDWHEREADAVADSVMRMAEPPAVSPAPAVIGRMCAECEQEERRTIQTLRAPSVTDPAALDVGTAIHTAHRGGTPLPPSTRAFFEPRFGHDLSRVRIHADGEAASSARTVQARAYTLGRDIVFGANEYQPDSDAGRHLLAHELTHVLQQTGPSLLSSGRPTPVGASREPVLQREATEDPDIDDEGGHRLAIARTPLAIQRTASISGWSFSNSGATAGDNCCPQCPVTLGVSGPARFKNGMELMASLSGHDAGTTYDIKRTKERSTWKRSGGAWTNLTHVGPGADDDSHNSDECLVPSSSPEHIYSTDTPGFNAAAAPSAGDTDKVYKASFLEFVEVTDASGGQTDANTFEWHTITWLVSDGGAWRLDVAQSEIASGAVTVGTTAP